MAGIVILAGVVLRVELMRHYNDDPPDLRAFRSVSTLLTHDFFHAYRGTIANRHGGTAASWTYPAGLFPLLIVDHIFVRAGISLRTLIAIPNFLADIGMSVLLFRYLASRRGHGAALAGCALVSLGWPFFLGTGVMNQVDSITTIFALIAVMLWASNVRNRTVWACVCLGIATSIKLPFVFLVLAFLPTCKDWREGARVVGIVAGVPLVLTAPFLIVDFHQVASAITGNHGLPGFAGWSLFVEPAFRHVWLDGQVIPESSTVRALTKVEPEIVLGALIPIGVVLWYFRVNVVRSAAIVSLAIWASNATPVPTYLIWLLPFVIVDEQLWAAGMIEAAGLFAAIQLFLLSPHPPADALYVPIMVVLQVVVVGVLVSSIVRVTRNEAGRGNPLRAKAESPPVSQLVQDS